MSLQYANFKNIPAHLQHILFLSVLLTFKKIT